MSEDRHNVGLAFAVVILAGSATAVGASIVFFPRYVKYANRITLAGGLGLSAGVMVYVSFVEILRKSQKSFIKAGFSDNTAYQYATCCFFGGIVVMVVSSIAFLVIDIMFHENRLKKFSFDL